MKIKITSTESSWYGGDANEHVTIGEVYEAVKPENGWSFETFGNDKGKFYDDGYPIGPWMIHPDDCEVVEE